MTQSSLSESRRMKSAFGEQITCPRLCGAKDATGKVYEGPPCEGCDECTEYESVVRVLHEVRPYRVCTLHDAHQMFLCNECASKSHGLATRHWYCPEKFPYGITHNHAKAQV